MVMISGLVRVSGAQGLWLFGKKIRKQNRQYGLTKKAQDDLVAVEYDTDSRANSLLVADEAYS